MTDHHINIFFSDEDGGYIADIPDLKAYSTFAAIPKQVLCEVEAAHQVRLEAPRTAGNPLPEPTGPLMIYQGAI